MLSKKNRSLMVLSLLTYCSFYTNDVLAASVPVTNGKYNATTAGIYDAINFSDRIKNIKASNGAIVTVSKGDTVISGVDDGSVLGIIQFMRKVDLLQLREI